MGGLIFISLAHISKPAKEVLMVINKWGFIAFIFISTLIYAGFSIFVIKRLFEKEEVFFRT
jgi:hypothetical protein